ncbi:hypothetical protein [Siccirubricoccus phaeus]|uniref:hypothetical protein n=1 Tax=Siccirubricoccus phaeus TaxID=2595053 RepID=UPI0011F36D9D|nr:hypothetical protein [Siccirubricoccus phaeus]
MQIAPSLAMPRLPAARTEAPQALPGGAGAAAPAQTFQATPNPAMKLDPRLGLVVLQFRDDQGQVTATLPTERELAAYRNAGKRPAASPAPPGSGGAGTAALPGPAQVAAAASPGGPAAASGAAGAMAPASAASHAVPAATPAAAIPAAAIPAAITPAAGQAGGSARAGGSTILALHTI